ncbi:MAG: hypothetical protein PF570_08125 [Candidatus Cloacimonetes bacterium]|jgi:hypothetical protein|nr:hypothetical protein [Candidatus Cloacimonadota bacterium]
MKKIFMITLILIISSAAIAQELDNDIIQINYEKKSLAKAMMLSSLFPGAGQFYANPRSITTYIFPLIEIGLIAGYFINYNEGLDKEAEYQDFADIHYNRDQQWFAQEDLINDPMNNSNFYADHFRLDGIEKLDDGSWYIWENNTQHFYEDIGKYNKYVFGWNDWFDIYATDENGATVSPEWLWEETTDEKNMWIGNTATNPGSEYLIGNTNYSDPYTIYSGYRAEYIGMRRDAEDLYDKAEYFSFGLVANHILAAIDAVRLTRIHNREYLSNTSQLEINFAPIFVNNNFSPALMITKRF